MPYKSSPQVVKNLRLSEFIPNQRLLIHFHVFDIEIDAVALAEQDILKTKEDKY